MTPFSVLDARGDLLARAVNWQLAKRRSGNHQVKGRSDVKATGSKPFKQKGTGVRVKGTSVAPQMRGGGIVFGPHTRDHGHKLPKKVRKLALATALSAKVKEGKFVVIDEAKMPAPKTKDLLSKLDKLGWGRALVIDGDAVDANFARAARNIIGIDVLPSAGANVYDILRRDTLVFTTGAVEKLVERLK
jgi:large subunit ribosomal protein L4